MLPQFFSPNCQRIITLTSDLRPNSPVRPGVWQPGTDKVDALDKQGVGQLIWAGYIADGACVLARVTTEGKDTNIKYHITLFNGETGQRIAGPFTHALPIRQAALSRDGKTLAIVAATVPDPFGREKARRAELHVWDVRSGKAIGQRDDLATPPSSLSVGSASRTVAMVRPNLVDLSRVDPLKSLSLRHAGAITSVTFSNDERFIATSSADRSARIWNVDTGEPIGLPLEHRAQVTFAAISPCNRYVATCSADNTARVWTTHAGEPVTPWLLHPGEVVHASFSGDSKRLITASHAGTACIWPVIAEENRPPADIVRVAEILSASRLPPQGGLTPLGASEYVKTWQGRQGK
jgi:WD40 repeat protein